MVLVSRLTVARRRAGYSRSAWDALRMPAQRYEFETK